MVPTDYRLDSVVERLIQRLEGARPTHTDPATARAAFEATAATHVEAAIAEWRAVAPEDPEAHAAFLRREVLQTALPRYHRLATRMTAAEQRGYGLGPLAGPLGTPALLFVAVAVFALILRRFLGFWEVWPLVVLDLSLPAWPLLAAWLHVRRYRAELGALVEDMERIQDAERTFLSGDALRAAQEVEAAGRTTGAAQTTGAGAEAPPPKPDREVERG